VFPPRVHSWSNFNFDFLFKYSQSEKFDPDGVYIRRWVPELAGLKTAKAVHNPHSVLSKKEIAAMGYRDTPIVEHKVARERAIEAFKLVLGKGMKIRNGLRVMVTMTTKKWKQKAIRKNQRSLQL
jgi:hypothetical protein